MHLTADQSRFLGWILRQGDRDRLLVGWLMFRSRPSELELELAGADLNLKDRVREFELKEIERVVAELGGDVTRAARKLGLDRTGIYRKLRRAGKSVERPTGSR